MFFFFFFKQKTAYEMRISDWSSDVCSSDLIPGGLLGKTVTITFELVGGFQELSPAVIEALGASTTLDSRTTATIVGTVFFLEAIKLSADPQGDPLMPDGDLPREPAGKSAELPPERLAALSSSGEHTPDL